MGLTFRGFRASRVWLPAAGSADDCRMTIIFSTEGLDDRITGPGSANDEAPACAACELEAPMWSENTRRVLNDRRARVAVHTIGEVAGKVREYLYVRTILGLMSAAAAGVWLLILDIDLVLVWVVLTFLLNYIPNLGSIIAVIPPALMAVIQHGGMHGVITIGGLAVLEQVIGNFIDPRMQGRRLRVSPVVVLVALVFWSWMWGPIGALLAVPATVTLLAAASHVPALRPLSLLLAIDPNALKRSPHDQAE